MIGPKAKDVEGTGAEAKIGPSFLCDAIGSKMAVGVGGGMRRVDAGWWMAGGTAAGVCDQDGVISFHTSAPIVSLYFFISLTWLLPFPFSPFFGGWEADGVMPVGASAPFAFSGIERSFSLDSSKSETVVEASSGCDADGMMPVAASAAFAFSEIGWFPREAYMSTTVIYVGGGMRGVDSGRWMAGGVTRIGVFDEDGVMPVSASAPFAS